MHGIPNYTHWIWNAQGSFFEYFSIYILKAQNLHLTGRQIVFAVCCSNSVSDWLVLRKAGHSSEIEMIKKYIYKNIFTLYIWLNDWIIDIISVIIQNLRWSQIWVAPSLVILYTDLSPPFYWCPSLPHIRELVSAIHWYF